MRKTEMAAIQRVNPEAGFRKCLGHWCGHKDFFSTGPGNRYCPKCDTKKNQVAQAASGIKVISAYGSDEGHI